jgi:hypothetical protein
VPSAAAFLGGAKSRGTVVGAGCYYVQAKEVAHRAVNDNRPAVDDAHMDRGIGILVRKLNEHPLVTHARLTTQHLQLTLRGALDDDIAVHAKAAQRRGADFKPLVASTT